MVNELSYPNKKELMEIIDYISSEAKNYLEKLDSINVRYPDYRPFLQKFESVMPLKGKGAMKTLKMLVEEGLPATVASSGPKFFHFVVGGVTPASLGADLITSITDQNAYAHISSPLAVKLELVTLNWLKEIFGLPTSWGGIMTTGATMAIYIGLISARQWAGERYNIDVFEDGFKKLPEIPIYVSKILHASDSKVVGMLGFGRNSIQVVADEEKGIFKLNTLEEHLKAQKGNPSIIIAVAGEPNAGLFDQVPQLVDLARKYNAWLHIDGAFGLFAKLNPETAHLVEGLEKADSIAVDGHKWLNVPHDCGFGFVRDQTLMEKSFRYSAEYLPNWSDEEPVLGIIGPESSRRARSFAVWATLFAYGKEGLIQLIIKKMDQAKLLAELITKSTDFELLEKVIINVVCFRYRPKEKSEIELNTLNTALGKQILDDGRVFIGTTTYKGKIALRPAIVNWRTEDKHIHFLFDVIKELARKLKN